MARRITALCSGEISPRACAIAVKANRGCSASPVNARRGPRSAAAVAHTVLLALCANIAGQPQGRKGREWNPQAIPANPAAALRRLPWVTAVTTAAQQVTQRFGPGPPLGSPV